MSVVVMAQNLARNTGFSVFPVAANKHPTRPTKEGGEGYKDATKDPDRIAWLWDRWPGPLIGIATGAMSGISVLDVDQKHHEAWEWWQANHFRLLPTRTFETRSGGAHLHFRHVAGVSCSRGSLPVGVDIRGDGGYIIYWFAAGFGCHDHSQPAPWPDWLLAAIAPPARAEPSGSYVVPSEASLAGILRKVASAQEGERNAVLFWAACRLTERQMLRGEIEGLLLPAAREVGLPHIEAARTINSAIGRPAA